MYNGHQYMNGIGSMCSPMMDRSNIESAISRGGEHKAMSSLAHLSTCVPSLFTPSYKQQDGGYCNSHTQGRTNALTRTHGIAGKHTGIRLCVCAHGP